jgi:hypothetical protein
MVTNIKKASTLRSLRLALIMPIALSLSGVTFAHELGLQLHSVRKKWSRIYPKLLVKSMRDQSS